MERKAFDAADLKMLDEGSGYLSGYASTFANFDSVGERVVKGAFAKSIPAFLKDGFIAVGHNWSVLPIATPLEAYEDDHGLFVRAEFHTTPEAQNARTVVRERMQRGKSVKFSIGYEVLDDERTKDGRLLKDLNLYEWSIVTVPANQLAMATDIKGWSGADLSYTEHSERVVSCVEEFAHRAKERIDFRLKEGRVFSATNRKKIQDVVSMLQELLAMSEPAPKTDPQPTDDVKTAQMAELDAMFQRAQRISQLLGVTP